jgi:hypothetical protein
MAAPPNAGRKSSPTWSGEWWGASTAPLSMIADTDAAAAQIATRIPVTGSVLTSGRTFKSAHLPRYSAARSAKINSSPAISGTNVTGSRNRWVSSSEAPKNAATQPPVANPRASGSRGLRRSTGGTSSKVRSDSTSAARAIQNSGRQARAEAWTPPMNGPSATAPKMQRFKMIAVQRALVTG